MMKALVIVDMQEDYIGEKSKYKFLNRKELIENINNRIKAVEKDTIVICVKNMGKGMASDLVNSLHITTDLIFTKEKSSCFSSYEFVSFLTDNRIKDIELVGVDGNCCVKHTAIDGIKNDLIVTVPLQCVGVLNKERFLKTRQELMKYQVKMID